MEKSLDEWSIYKYYLSKTCVSLFLHHQWPQLRIEPVWRNPNKSNDSRNRD